MPLNHLSVTHLNNASHRAEGFSETRMNFWHGRISSSQHHNKWTKHWARALLWGRSKAQSTEVFLSPKLIGWLLSDVHESNGFLATVFYSWCMDWNHIGCVSIASGDCWMNGHEKNIFSHFQITVHCRDSSSKQDIYPLNKLLCHIKNSETS